jgi:hypothetical protein
LEKKGEEHSTSNNFFNALNCCNGEGEQKSQNHIYMKFEILIRFSKFTTGAVEYSLRLRGVLRGECSRHSSPTTVRFWTRRTKHIAHLSSYFGEEREEEEGGVQFIESWVRTLTFCQEKRSRGVIYRSSQKLMAEFKLRRAAEEPIHCRSRFVKRNVLAHIKRYSRF